MLLELQGLGRVESLWVLLGRRCLGSLVQRWRGGSWPELVLVEWAL